MKLAVSGPFGARLKALREAAGFTQEELATIAGLSVHAVSALERGERRRPQVGTVRALSAALDLTGADRDALIGSARGTSTEVPSADDANDAPLPLAMTALLGRDADLQTLRRWFHDPAVRLVTLTGPGGVGKTRLALEVARAIATEGATRVLFVPLSAVRETALVAPAIAEALGLSDVTANDLPSRARVACGDRPTLLVLDNCEQLLQAAPLFADMLASAASIRLLATSRAPLHVRGEREFSVEPLAVEGVAGLAAGDPISPPAVQLFVDRVRDAQPDFQLTSANAPVVTAICRRLDALPLALELAAAWIKILTPENLLARLTQDVLLTTASPRDLPERQQTMNATVAWSYQLLGAAEQRAFRRLGALPGRFPIDAAAAVLAGGGSASDGGDALGAVAALIDKSLLHRAETNVPARPLYRMLETVRAYAALELAASGERDDALDGLARYCTGEATRASEGLVGPAQAEWLNRVRDDLESYRGGLAWLIENGRAAEATGVAWGLMFFWAIRGHAAEGLRWYGQILRFPSLQPDSEAKLLFPSAVMWYTQGELERARTALTRAIALAQGGGDILVVVLAENLLAHVAYAEGQLDEARERFVRSVTGFRALGLSWGTGNSLSGLAWVALASGDTGQAVRLLDEATVVLQASGPWFVLLPLYVRAILAVRRKDASQAIALARDSLIRVRDLQDKFAFVYALVPLAGAAVLRGYDAWAARILGVRDAVTERTGATVVDQAVLDLREEAERGVRARLGPDRWARAYATGYRMSVDALLRDIDQVAAELDRHLSSSSEPGPHAGLR